MGPVERSGWSPNRPENEPDCQKQEQSASHLTTWKQSIFQRVDSPLHPKDKELLQPISMSSKELKTAPAVDSGLFFFPPIEEFKVPLREEGFVVVENCINSICSPDHFQGLRFQECIRPAYEHHKSLGRTPEAYQTLKGYYMKYVQECGQFAEA